jgi:zinc transporter ZupT
VAVILHEIPQEVGDFSVLIYAGYAKTRALFLNFLSALCAFLGAAVFFVLGEVSETFSMYLIPLTAGGFIYIAIVDLIPELGKTKQATGLLRQLIAVSVGVGLMALLLLFE